MAPFVRKIKAVRRRLMLARLCRRAVMVLTWVAAALTLYVMASRVTSLAAAPEHVAPWLAGAGALWLAGWMLWRRISLLEAALAADEALGLKERLSTALRIERPRSEPESAVLEDANAHAEKVRPGEVARVTVARELRYLTPVLAALVLAWLFMPQIDLSAREKGERKPMVTKVETERESAKRLKELAAEIAKEGEVREAETAKMVERELEALAKELREQMVTPEQAMARMEKLGDKLKQEQGRLENALETQNTMNAAGAGRRTAELAKEMQKGNFEQAQKALEALQEKVASGEMSEAEQKALGEEMKALAEKMGAQSPVGQAMAEAAKQLEEGNANQAMAGMQEAMNELGQMDSLMDQLAMLEKMEAQLGEQQQAMAQQQQQGKPGECQNCGGELDGEGKCSSCGGGEGEGNKLGQGQGKGQSQGQWKPGETDKKGNGMGGPGKGRGGVAPKTETATALVRERVRGQVLPGEVLARMKVEGTQEAGEITTQYESLRMEYAQQAEDAVERETMPLEFKGLVRDYFDAIRQGAPEAEKKAAGNAPVAAPAAR